MSKTKRDYTEFREPMPITPRHVEYIPNTSDMEPGILYLAPQWETASHLCPCGCGQPAVTPLGRDDGWDLQQEGDLVTLHPSLLNTFECRSHYWIRRNQVVWAQ